MSAGDTVVIAPEETRLATLAQAAKYAGASASTVRTWRSRHGTFPAPVITVQLVDGPESFYDLDAILAWVDDRKAGKA